jgi:hypothetical protein
MFTKATIEQTPAIRPEVSATWQPRANMVGKTDHGRRSG